MGPSYVVEAMRHCRTINPARIFTTKTYERAVRKLMSEADRQKMEAAIVAHPGRPPLLRGTGGIRKLRWTGSGIPSPPRSMQQR